MIAKALPSIFRWTAAIGVLVAASVLPAAAVVVDEFTTPQGPLSDPPGGATSVPTGGADILGQHRDLVVDLAAGTGPVDAEVTGGFLIMAVTDTTPDSRGAAFVTWDGDTNPNALAATGLGGVDLTASGHTALAIAVDAAGAGVEIVLEVYTDAANMSRAALRLPAVASSTTFYLSYKSDFVTRLGAGADFADVGAIVMTVRGTETAVTIDRVETAAPSLAVVKRDLTLGDVSIGATPQAPGTTFKYRITITNTGGEALAVDLSDTIDANTTVNAATVDATPVAVGDAYEAYGNVTRTVAAPGLLANDVDPDQNGAPPELVVDTSGSPVATALGGTATLSADGAFVYGPPAGVGKAVDTFTYTVTDNEGNATTATVTMNIGRRIWFVDDDADVTAGVDGTGTLADPYDQLTPLSAAGGAGDPDEPGDLIFLYAGTYASGIELEPQQELIGHAEGLTLDGDPIVPAGAAPTINNAAGHGIMLATNNTIRGLTVGNTTGADVNGSNFGTLTVSSVTLNGTGAALNLSNGTLDATFISMSSTNSLGRGVNLDTVTGLLTSGSTSVTDSAQAGIRVVNGGSTYNFGPTTLTSTTSGLELTNNATSTFNFTSLAVTTDAGAGLMASSSGTLTIGGVSNTIVATGGAALDVTSTSLGAGATFSTVSSSGSGGKGFNFDGVTGNFTATAGSISTATGIAFDVNAGTGAISYAGGITNAANRAVEVTGRTTSTVTISGNVSDSGTGVNIASNSGGTITLSGTYSGTAASSQIDVTGNSGTAAVNFSGSSKVLSTGAGNAIDVTSNGTATVNFTGGGLSVTTTSGVGLNATGGGTLTVQGSNNVVSSTTGTAVNVVTPTTIGAAGVTLKAVSANGAGNAIVVNGAGTNFFKVEGDGTLARNGSGGTINNTSGDAIQLTNAHNVTLQSMNLTNNGSAPASAAEATGTAGNHTIQLAGGSNLVLSGVLVQGSKGTGLLALNLTGTSRINNNSRFEALPAGLEHGIYVENVNTDMTLFELDAVQMVNSSSSSSTVFFANTGTSSMRLDVKNGCLFEDLASQAVTASAGGSAATTGTLTSNIIGSFFQNAKGTGENNVGILVNNGATHVSLVQSNLFDNIAEDGTIANTSIVRTQNSGGVMNATVKQNTIQNIAYSVGGRHAIGHVFEPVAYSAANASTLVFENNTVTNVTYTSTNREAVFVDYRGTASGGKVTVLSNNFNMPTSGSQQAIELRFRQTNASTVNVLVRGNTVTHNTTASFLDVDAEAAATVNVTIDGSNNFTNNNATPGQTVDVASEAAGSSLCANITGNTLQSGGGTITVNEAAGTVTVTQASAAALASANGIPAANVTVVGSPSFGQPACALP